MIKLFILLYSLLTFNKIINSQTFIDKQLSYTMVKEAFSEKYSILEILLKANNLDVKNYYGLIRIFKKEKILELWAKKIEPNSPWMLINIYKICSPISILGPKISKEDEYPEGIYYIKELSSSNEELSLKLDFPNAADMYYLKVLPNSEIKIVGTCFQSQNFSVPEDKIKEIYLFTLFALANGQKFFPIHIFPCKLSQENLNYLIDINPNYQTFWKSLFYIYNYFEKFKELPQVIINTNGTYSIE